MPIVSKRLQYIRQQADGFTHVCEIHTDDQGVEWPVRYCEYNVSETAALATMNARDMTDVLVTAELIAAYELAVAAGDGRAPTPVNTTRQKMDRYIIKRMNTDEDGRLDLGPLCTWLLGFSASQISTALWNDTSASHLETANKILARCNKLVTDLIPDATGDNEFVEEMEDDLGGVNGN